MMTVNGVSSRKSIVVEAPSHALLLDAVCFGRASFTIQVHVWLARDGHAHGLFGFDSYSKGRGLHCIIDGVVRFGFYENDIVGKTVLLPERWYGVCCAYSLTDGRMALWIDGALDAHDYGRAPNEETSVKQVLLGRSRSSRHLIGKVAEFRVWNIALDDAMVEDTWGRHLTSQEVGSGQCVRYFSGRTEGTLPRDDVMATPYWAKAFKIRYSTLYPALTGGPASLHTLARLQCFQPSRK